MNITEFLSYKNLDQKQANMILEMAGLHRMVQRKISKLHINSQ